MAGFGAVGKSAMRLSYLIARADGTMAQLTDDSLLAQLLSIDGDVSDYNDNTDSLEAISNAVGAISTGDAVAEIGSFTAQTNLQTLLAALGIPDVSAKGLYNCLVPDRLDNATYGLSALRTQSNLAYAATTGATADEFAGHIKHYGGEIFYVTKEGDDAEDGSSIHLSKLTIQAAIDAGAPGDGIVVKAGTYVENVVLNEVSMELWPESGCVIDPATGTPLTVSANYCRIYGDLGIDVPAGEVGMLVSGNFCRIKDATILNGGTGVCVTGSGNVLVNMAAGLQTVYGYDIDGSQTRLSDSSTVGAGASIGYNIGGGADIGVIKNCTSANHQTSGYTIETGCANWTILNCSSGGGDGLAVDVDSANVWSNFQYDDEATKTITFTGVGASPTSINLFRVYGSVRITELYGHVETALAADVGTVLLELYDGTNTVDLTDSPGPSFASVPAGSYIHKIDDAGVAIAIEDSSQVRLYEDATKNGRDPSFQVTAKAGAFESYIRMTYQGNGASGAIHWHCKWEQLTDEGRVTAA